MKPPGKADDMMAIRTKLDTYIRDDRDQVAVTTGGLEGILNFVESVNLIEMYGLSLDEHKIEWMCFDPKRRYLATANSPAGAVIMWDARRQNVEGADDAPKLTAIAQDVIGQEPVA